MSNVNEERQPSYYAIIPSTVRYDENLKFAERLLYGEITALIGKDGYCFAKNNYFAKLFGVIPGTISRWISHLSRLGYIKVDVIRNEKNEVIERRIFITDISCRKIVSDTYEQSCTYPYKQNETDPMSKKAKDNNINIRIDRFFNYIINIKGEIPKDVEKIYNIIEKLELNYTKEIIETFTEENIDKIKIIMYCIKLIFESNKRNILLKATREKLIDIYDHCRKLEKEYKETDKEINNFFEYFYASVVRKLEAK